MNGQETGGSAAQVKSERPESAAEVGSSAERIAGIRRLLEADRERQVELEHQLAELEQQFAEASDEFSRLDAKLAEQQPQGKSSKEKQNEPVAPLERDHAAARQRFDAIIRRRKAFQQQLEVLKDKIAVAQQALERATTAEDPAAKIPPAATEPVPSASSARPVPQHSANSDTETKDASKAFWPLSGIEMPGGAGAAPAPTGDTNHVVDRRVQDARKGLVALEAELRAAEQDVGNRDRAIDVFERDIASIRELLDIAREELRAAEAAADPERIRTAQDEVRTQTERLAQSEDLLTRLKAGREELAKRVTSVADDIESARLQVQFLESPLAPHQLLRWLLRAGPRILAVIVAMFACWWLSRILAQRIVATVILRSARGTVAEREGRAETMRRVFQSTASSAIVVLGLLALLDQAGVNVTVLLGGAAVLGAAIAFGSQNLLKDYFSGFMILIENQYSVGNVIRIGSISGVVEDITLRTTVLRDEEGVVHFLPHSQVAIVSNLTHGWSRAVFKISVGYREDVDRAMRVLLELAQEMRNDEKFRDDLIDEPEMLGVDALGDSAVVIKFLVKTRPLRQWAVKRELLRRIKRKFDELGIEIPYPQQVVHWREKGAEASEPSGGQ